ncbi:unnamed protein product [Ixodes pacificus]
MLMKSSFGGRSLGYGTRFVASVILCVSSVLFTWFLISLYHRQKLLDSLNTSMGFEAKPASPLIEFVAVFGFGLILLFEIISAWMAIKATYLENRWLLMPFIGLTGCGIVTLVLILAIYVTCLPTYGYQAPNAIGGIVSALTIVLLRAYFLLVAVSYYQELQERDVQQGGAVPSVSSGVPQTHIDDLPDHKRHPPFLLDYLQKPPPYESLDSAESKGDFAMRLYI